MWKDPGAGAAGAGAGAVEQPRNEAEHGNMKDKGAEVQRDEDEPRENRGDEEGKSEEKEEEEKKDEAAGRLPCGNSFGKASCQRRGPIPPIGLVSTCPTIWFPTHICGPS